jgi:hypothetical protein
MMNSIRFCVLCCLSTLIFCDLSMAVEPFWLSGDPPKDTGRMRRSHGGPVEVRKGVYYKHLWLRQGGLPMEAAYVASLAESTRLVLLDTEGKTSEKSFTVKGESGFFSASFPMPAEGFYNAYVTLQRLDGEAREVQVAKAEVLKHSCREGHDNVQEKMPPRHHNEVPLEIVRERQPSEDFHSRVGYGDTISFLVLRNGVAQPGVKVVLTSGQGWSRQRLSDEQGRVRYTMIRDYYPSWELFEKRHAQPYMVQALYTLPEAGELDGKPYSNTRYLASFSGHYYPSPNDYESYAYGLSFGLFALVATGLGITRYRRSRNRPYREVSFDE